MQIRNKHIHQNAAFVRETISLSAEVGSGVQIGDHLVADATLAIDTVPEDFQTTTTAIYVIDAAQYEKAAATGISFSAADTINTGTATGDFWGAWVVQVNAAGTVSTKPAGGLSDQVYASKAAAVAALPAADADNVKLGHIAVGANTNAAWTANTDDLTAASDCQAVEFLDVTPGEAVTDGLFDSFVPGYAFEVVGVQHIAEEVVATASCIVKIAARDAVSAITPVTGTRGDATLSTTSANVVGTNTEAINLYCSTDASGLLEGLKVHVTIRPQGLRA